MRYITDNNGYLLEVSFGAVIQCGGKGCTEYTGGVPSGYTDLVDWFAKEGDKLYRWKIAGGQLALDSSVPVKPDPVAMFAEFGLGKIASSVTDLDSLNTCGWWECAWDANGNPFYGYGGVVMVSASTAITEQTAITGYGGCTVKRSKGHGETAYHEWEWVNPPMIGGVEYRTTERWNGEPVYTKLINCGDLPASGRAATYMTPVGGVLRYSGYCHLGGLPYRDPTANGTIDMAVEKDYIIFTVSMNKAFSPRTAYVQIWYTKD